MSSECFVLVSALGGAVVGALITVFSSNYLESRREKERNEKRLISIARTIASEIYYHTDAVEALLSRREHLSKVIKKLNDVQWQEYQNELWGLDPSLGILFRKYYSELENIKTTEFNHSSDIEKIFVPFLELAKECLRKADFPMRKGGAVASVHISTEINPDSKSKND